MKQNDMVQIEFRCEQPAWEAMQLVMILRSADEGDNYHTLKHNPSTSELPYTARLEGPYGEQPELYLYIIPHTLPATNDIYDCPTLRAELTIRRGDKRLLCEELTINPWGGLSRIIRLDELTPKEQ